MRRINGITAGLAALLVLGAAAGRSEPAAEVRERAKAAFDAVNRRFEQAATLQYRVTRRSRMKGVAAVERWTFSWAAPGRIRIDYTEPEKRTFILDGRAFLEYLPDVRRALLTPLEGGADPRATAALKRLSVEGLRIDGGGDLLAHLATASETEPGILMVEGADPRYRIRIDLRRALLLDYEQWDREGALSMRIRAADFTEPAPGFWMPGRVTTVMADKDATAEREVGLTAIRVNGPIPQEYFDFSLPDDVIIQTNKAIQAGTTGNEEVRR